MHVGVFLVVTSAYDAIYSLPHARGGVSSIVSDYLIDNGVFPMHVGVFPFMTTSDDSKGSLPHARGGVSF